MAEGDPAPIDAESHAHVQEAIRHLHAAAELASCGVCRDLWTEEREHLEMAEGLTAQVEEFVRTQAEKREQLSDADVRAAEIAPGDSAAVASDPLVREHVEERVHTGPGGETHAEVVRGVETAPRPARLIQGTGTGPIDLARSWMRDRPRLTDVLSPGGSRRPAR